MAARTGDPTVAASPNATATSQSAPEDTKPAPVQTAEPTPAPVATQEPVAEATTQPSGDAADILAMIRNRQNNAQ